MRRTRSSTLVRTLAAAALVARHGARASERRRRRGAGAAGQHCRAADQRGGDGRLDAQRDPGLVGQLADELRLPVGAVPALGRAAERLGLRGDRRRDDVELRRGDG